MLGGPRKTRFRGTREVGWMFTLVAAAYNLVRPPTLNILNIKWRRSLNAMWRSLRRFSRDDVLIRFPVR